MVPRNDTLKINAHYLFVNKLIIAMLYYVVFDRFPVEPSGCHTPIFKQDCVAATVVLRLINHMEPSCCHVATSERGCAGGEAVSKRKPRKEGA